MGHRVVPTVVAGMDGSPGQTLEGESEAGTAVLTWSELFDEEETQGSCQSHWCPKGCQGLSVHHVTLWSALTSKTFAMTVHGPRLELQLSGLVMAVRVADLSDDPEKLTNFVEGRLDCRAFYRSEITDRLQMLLQLRRAMARYVRRRAELGVKRGLCPEE